MDRVAHLIQTCGWGLTLIVLGLVPGLFHRFVSGVAELASFISASPRVPLRNDYESSRPLWLAYAGLALLAAGILRFALA